MFQAAKGYESLGRILQAAHDQAAKGKGIDRHAKAGEPFDQQKICEITRRVGLGYPLGQAIKKAEESLVLGGRRGIAEVLGAINYLAAAVLIMEEDIKAEEDERDQAFKAEEAFKEVISSINSRIEALFSPGLGCFHVIDECGLAPKDLGAIMAALRNRANGEIGHA